MESTTMEYLLNDLQLISITYFGSVQWKVVKGEPSQRCMIIKKRYHLPNLRKKKIEWLKIGARESFLGHVGNNLRQLSISGWY